MHLQVRTTGYNSRFGILEKKNRIMLTDRNSFLQFYYQQISFVNVMYIKWQIVLVPPSDNKGQITSQKSENLTKQLCGAPLLLLAICFLLQRIPQFQFMVNFTVNLYRSLCLDKKLHMLLFHVPYLSQYVSYSNGYHSFNLW